MTTEKEKEETKMEISLVSDTTFKYLLKNERTRIWLYEIIKDNTGIDLEKFKLMDNELNTGNSIKDYRMDTVFECGNTIIIVELNNGNRTSQTIKAYQYLYRMQSNQFFSGSKYKERHTKLIMFNNFLNADIPILSMAHYKLMDKEQDLTIDDIESYEIYLPNFRKKGYNKCDLMERRLYLFGCENLEEIKGVVTDEKDENQIIVKEMERLEMDEEFLSAYNNEIVQKHMQEIERDEGYNEGFDSGKKENQIEIINNALKMNLPIKDIVKLTNLTEKEVNKIIKENI
jgi:predicted transposase/invertase (TIGR01784 family)